MSRSEARDAVALPDMPGRLKAEDALREADRRNDEFLAMPAHELRNPLAPIMVAAELLSRNPDNVRPVETAVEGVRIRIAVSDNGIGRCRVRESRRQPANPVRDHLSIIVFFVKTVQNSGL